MKLRGFITHKAAEYYSDCADYFRICPRTKRVAVSDGVSQSVLPAEWARLLVESYLQEEWGPDEPTEPLMEKWLLQAWDYVKEQRKLEKNPWLLENCLINKDGAAATFCGVQFSELNCWSAFILGDSTLVELDNDNQIIQIYSSKEGTFGFRPDYFESFGKDKGRIKKVSGKLEEGHKILLVSDPFSELFQNIKGTESEVTLITRILNIVDTEGFNTLVDSFRTDYQMHNDDSTLVIIEPDGNEEFFIAYEESIDSLIEDERNRLEEERKELERKEERDKILWSKAIEDNCEDAYKNYLVASELCNHKKEAEKRIKEIAEIRVEDDTWKGACELNSIDGFQKYIELFPSGRFIGKAKECISKLDSPSTHSKKPEGKDDSAESQLSEESFCKGEEQTKIEQSQKQNSSVAKEETESIKSEQTNSDQTEDKKEPENIQENEEPRSNDAAEKGTDTIFDKAGEDQGKSTRSTQRANRVYPNKMEVVSLEEEGGISLPNGIDPSDGIDKVEFQKLQGTAILLFKKYHERFEAAFRRQKWNADRASGINQCFADFWCELESIIFQCKNNG